MWKEVSFVLMAFTVFVFSVTYGKYVTANSCDSTSMFTYANRAYKCTEIKQ